MARHNYNVMICMYYVDLRVHNYNTIMFSAEWYSLFGILSRNDDIQLLKGIATVAYLPELAMETVLKQDDAGSTDQIALPI